MRLFPTSVVCDDALVKGLDVERWSLARQLVVLQVAIVVLTISIEAMVGIYRSPGGQRQLLGLVALSEVSLTVGIAGSLLLAGRVRRQTFNLEPAVIARLYQHHHAMLHAVSEGLIITDRDGTVVLVNDEALRLLRLPADSEGRPLAELLSGTALNEAALSDAGLDDTVLGDTVLGDAGLTDTGLLAAWAQDGAPVRDQLQVAAGRVLVVSRSPAEVEGVPVGMVTTLRDRTELQQALRELDDVRALALALREQSHESANRMQAVVGLVELGRYDDAVRLGTREATVAQRLSDEMVGQVADPALAALLLGKSGLAEQRGVELRLRAHGTITAQGMPSEYVLTIVGNLLDNALDAAAARPAASEEGGWVELELEGGGEGALTITVRDNGPGISAGNLDAVFTPGWTTKPSQQPGGRGLGLALVRHTVTRLGGTITVRNDNDGGAVFQACLPARCGTGRAIAGSPPA
jgi:two-component system, CitB family, sensor kinase